MAAYRILSLDGGGIRGLLTAIMLERIVKRVPDFLTKVDLIAGTSTGGILALGLAAGLTPTDLKQLYLDKGRFIFEDSLSDDIIDFGTLRGAQYDLDHLAQAAGERLDNKRLKDLIKKVLIPSFDLDNKDGKTGPLDPDASEPRTWKPKFFHNFEGTDQKDGDLLAVQVLLYTSAAPSYFPSKDGYVDGGVVANNPSMAALAQALDSRNTFNPPASQPQLSDISLLSLGTGRMFRFIESGPGKDIDWGILQWARPIINVMLDGLSGVADFQCRQLLGDKYHRLAPEFSENFVMELDDVDKMPDLAKFAKSSCAQQNVER